MPGWKLERTDEFARDLKSAVGRDGNLRNIVEKKIAKIAADPQRVGDGKKGQLKGLKSERAGHYVIIFECAPDPKNPPGVVRLRCFWHHNDPRYDP